MPQLAEGRARAATAALIVLTWAGSAIGAPTERPDSEFDDCLPECLELIEAGQFDEARERLGRALGARPNWAEGHVHLALSFVREGRWETAKKLYERALELDPDQHRIRVPFGWCLYYLGELEASRRQFDSFLAIEPDDPDAVYAVAMISIDEDDLDSATRLLRRVIILARARGDGKREALAHTRLADIYTRSGEISRAKLELRQALRLDPDNPKVHFKMSRVLQLLGDTQGADEARRKHEELLARSTAGAEDPGPFPEP